MKIKILRRFIAISVFSYKNEFFSSEYIVKKRKLLYMTRKSIFRQIKKRSIHYDKLHG